MHRFATIAITLTCLAAPAPARLAAQAPEPIDYATLGRIRDEGFRRSHAMEIVSWLSDVYGPRLTGGPEIKEAARWVEQQFAGWGLANIHEEPWPFGKGWSLVHFDASMVEPRVMPIIGLPKAWTPGTPGPVTAEVVLAPITSEADFAKYHGQLRGKIVLTQSAREVRMLDGRIVLRMNDDDIKEAESMPVPEPRPPRGARGGLAARLSPDSVRRFYADEGALAIIDRGPDNFMMAGGSDLSWQTQRVDGGTIVVQAGGSRGADAGAGIPAITIAVEHYNRMVRILEKKIPVKMALDVRTRFHDETAMNGFNIIAEIPGTDPTLKNEVVMLGAHFDSWHGATGATDNAAGSTAMIEAMRILKAIGAKPRRTIRVALWGGEEEGLLGSRAYVKAHFADPETRKTLPAYETLAAYFNLDNGTGKIRGIWMQENLAVRPIFTQWIAPLAELGVTILGPRSVTSTDHISFDVVGLPGFQFVQERLEYNSRTHHSNMDFVDRIQREDLEQQAVVAASFAYLAAMRDEKLPRKPWPE
jgi:hypothetical protein